MSERSHTALRTATFVERLLARSRPRAGHRGPVEMTLRRTAPAVVPTIVQPAAPITVSHHHAGPEIHVGIAMHLAARDRAPAGPARADRAPVVRNLLGAVVVRDVPRMSPIAPRSVVAPLPPPIVLRPASRPAEQTGVMHPGSPPASTVVTTVRREEHVRVETVVRRGVVDAPTSSTFSTSAVSPSTAAPRPGDVAAEAAPGPRRWSPPATQRPVGLPEAELGRLTDRVVQRIQRRVNTQRERMGGR